MGRRSGTTYQRIRTLGVLKDLLKMPGGGKHRCRVLVHDRLFNTDNGKTMIPHGELGDACERVGGPYSNYKP